MKGTVHGKIPSINRHITPKISDIRLFHAKGSVASWPTAEVTVPEGYKMIGGGARVNWTGFGNLLTACYPTSFDTWHAAAKDDEVSSPADIDIWAIAIHDPRDEFEVVIDHVESIPQDHPDATGSARDGFQLVGGGVQAHWNGPGQLLTASCPIGQGAWRGMSKDHLKAEINTITTYVISMRPRNGGLLVPIHIRQITTDRAEHPEGECPTSDDCRLIGGGAQVNWTGVGNLLTASYPTQTSWVAKAKDHEVADPATLTIYAIGIPESYFA